MIGKNLHTVTYMYTHTNSEDLLLTNSVKRRDKTSLEGALRLKMTHFRSAIHHTTQLGGGLLYNSCDGSWIG